MSRLKNFFVRYLSAEEAANEEETIKQKLLAGEKVSFSDCNYLLDAVDDVESWELVAQNNLLEPNNPPVNILENYDSEDAIQFVDMVRRIINACVTLNENWVQLPFDFIKHIIMFSKNIDALYCIADLQIEDLIDRDVCDANLFEEIKTLAYNRYNHLSIRRRYQ